MDDGADGKGARVVVGDVDGTPVVVWRRLSATRINGLVWEDTVRTTDIFPDTVIPNHPTAPIDIPPEFDLIQGVPTHVKSVRVAEGAKTVEGWFAGSVTLSCALQLFLLDRRHPHSRLVIGLYDHEQHVIDGVDTKVLCYHTVIEVIQSPTTAARYRGAIGIQEMRVHKAAMHAFASSFPIGQTTIDEAKRRFHPTTREWRRSKRMGIARISNKINEDQCRPQAQVSLAALEKQMRSEPKYDGRIEQDNWIVHTGSFHGLPLPFRTTGKDRVFLKGDPEELAERKPKKPCAAKASGPSVDGKATTTTDPDAKYLGRHVGREDVALPGGVVMVVPVDAERTIAVKTGDEPFKRHVSRACKQAGGRWIEPRTLRAADGREVERGRMWVLGEDQAEFALRCLRLPPPDPSAMESVGGNGNLFVMVTADGIPVRTILQDHSVWAMRPDDGRGTSDPGAARAASAAVIDAVCRLDPRCSWNDRYRNWVVPQDPPTLIHSVAAAIRNHRSGRR